MDNRRFSLPGGGLSLGALGLAFWLLAVTTASPGHIKALGLITIVGWPYFVALALLVTGFAIELAASTLRPARLTVLLIGLVVILFGTSSALFAFPTLTDSYIASGFVQHLVTNGHIAHQVDARFYWPGAFSLAAALVTFVGQHDAMSFLRWYPLVIELAYVAPLLALAKASGVRTRTGFLGVALFYATNWIHQDYFSPQSLNFLFFLVIVSTAMTVWKAVPVVSAGEISLSSRLRSSLASLRMRRLNGYDVDVAVSSGQELALIGVILVLILAVVSSHQLTPITVALALGGLLLTRRLRRPELVVAAGVLTWAWVSLSASDFWGGKLYTIFGTVGHTSASINQNLTNRIAGSASHVFVVDLRIATIGAVLLVGAFGALRRATDDRSLEFLALVPFVLVLGQSYGGEGLLRAALFSLPFASLLAASTFAPNHEGTITPWIGAGRVHRSSSVRFATTIAVVLTVTGVVFTIDRGGNDFYSSFTPGEVAAANYINAHLKPGYVFASESPFIPAGQTLAGSVERFYASVQGTEVPVNTEKLLGSHAQYVLITTSQERWGVEVNGYPYGWQTSVRSALLNAGYHVVAAWPTATVYAVSYLQN